MAVGAEKDGNVSRAVAYLHTTLVDFACSLPNRAAVMCASSFCALLEALKAHGSIVDLVGAEELRAGGILKQQPKKIELRQ